MYGSIDVAPFIAESLAGRLFTRTVLSGLMALVLAAGPGCVSTSLRSRDCATKDNEKMTGSLTFPTSKIGIRTAYACIRYMPSTYECAVSREDRLRALAEGLRSIAFNFRYCDIAAGVSNFYEEAEREGWSYETDKVHLLSRVLFAVPICFTNNGVGWRDVSYPVAVTRDGDVVVVQSVQYPEFTCGSGNSLAEFARLRTKYGIRECWVYAKTNDNVVGTNGPVSSNAATVKEILCEIPDASYDIEDDARERCAMSFQQMRTLSRDEVLQGCRRYLEEISRMGSRRYTKSTKVSLVLLLLKPASETNQNEGKWWSEPVWERVLVKEDDGKVRLAPWTIARICPDDPIVLLKKVDAQRIKQGEHSEGRGVGP
jgi:hypothetical protein